MMETKVNIPSKKARKLKFLTIFAPFWSPLKYFLRGNSSTVSGVPSSTFMGSLYDIAQDILSNK